VKGKREADVGKDKAGNEKENQRATGNQRGYCWRCRAGAPLPLGRRCAFK